MKEAKIFQSGGSQAVRIPKKYRLNKGKVYIKAYQGIIMLIPKENKWDYFLESLDEFSDDYLEDRNQPPVQKREEL
jgi:antitoxin VapB